MEEAQLTITNTGLALSVLMVIGAMILLWIERLHIQGEITIASIRCFIQLILLGYLIDFLFGLDQPVWILVMIVLMIVVGSHTARKRAGGLPGAMLLCFVALLTGTVVSLGMVFLTGMIRLEPRTLIPVAGIVIGNATRTLSISLDRLRGEIYGRRDEVEVALSLGASARLASESARRAALRAALIPSIDGMKIIGLVQMPGAMLGMILAGASPLLAVKLQILVLYLILASNTLSVVTGVEMACRKYFNSAQQLLPESNV